MRFFYTTVFTLLVPVIVLRLFWRSRRAPEYRQRMAERFGHIASPGAGTSDKQTSYIWLHCVSVGETLAAQPLVERLLADYPHLPLVITSTTPTGSAQVRRLWGDNKHISHCYMPYDLPWCLRGFLDAFKPRLALIMETEIWPNTIHLCHSRGIPTVLLNARLSAKSFNGYQRFAALSRPAFAALSLVLAQGEADQQRLQALGASRTVVTGSLKSDFSITAAMRQQAASTRSEWLEILGEDCTLLLAASTHEGEDEIVLDALESLKSRYRLLLLLVPRHPERFDGVYRLCKQRQLHTVRRSKGEALDSHTDVLLCDTLGELQTLLGTVDIAVMGGTFVDNGGHNFLEPAAWGLPQIAGASDYNFATITPALAQTGALQQLDSASGLAGALEKLIQNSQETGRRGQAALDYIDRQRGALDRSLTAIRPYLEVP